MENESLEMTQNTPSAETLGAPANDATETVTESAATIEHDQVDTAHENNHEIKEVPVVRKEFREDGVRTSSIFPEPKEGIEVKQNMMSTPFLLIFLVLVFFILKTFIYKKDDKRHGK